MQKSEKKPKACNEIRLEYLNLNSKHIIDVIKNIEDKEDELTSIPNSPRKNQHNKLLSEYRED